MIRRLRCIIFGHRHLMFWNEDLYCQDCDRAVPYQDIDGDLGGDE